MITREVKALLVCAVVALSLGVSKGQEAHAKARDTGTNARSATLSAQVTPEKKAKPRPKQLSGAELYSIHCNRCHPERYPIGVYVLPKHLDEKVARLQLK